MVKILNILQQYEQTHTNGDTEAQLKALYIDVIRELLSEKITDIHHYGMPFLGSPKVVERFTKQDGLVVVRRPDSSDEIMRVIYATWKALGSKRGLGFLEFVLQMLINDKWQIKRLYHDADRLDSYPTLCTPDKTNNSLLTSRIMIDLDQDVDIGEILELSPNLFRLVPANIVPILSSSLEFGDLPDLSTYLGFLPYYAIKTDVFNVVAGDDSGELPTLDWSVSRIIDVLSDGLIRYYGTKINDGVITTASALIDAREHLITQFTKPAYQNHQIIHDVVASTFDMNFIGGYYNNANQILEVAVIADSIAEMVDVIKIRLALGGSSIKGYDDLIDLLEHFGYYVHDNKISTEIEDLSLSSEYQYVTDSTYSYLGFMNSAQKQVNHLKVHSSEWEFRELGELRVLTRIDENNIEFIQEFTENGVSDFRIISVSRSLNPNFIDIDSHGSAEVGSDVLTRKIEELQDLLSDTPNQYLSDLLDRVLGQASGYDVYPDGNYLFNQNKTYLPYEEIAESIVELVDFGVGEPSQRAFVFIKDVAELTLNPSPSQQIIKQADLIAIFENSNNDLIIDDLPFLAVENVSIEVNEYA